MKKKYVCDSVKSTVSEFLSAKCIVISGTDLYQRDQCYKYIMKNIDFSRKQTTNQPLNEGVDTFVFYGDEFAKDEKIFTIMEALNSYSFDLSEKIITIKNFENLNAKALVLIAHYTENPSSQAKLILIADKLDGRSATTTTLQKNCLFYETTEMKYQSQLFQWLNQYLNQHQLKMDDQAKQLFANTVKPDAFTAYNEMKKLELYIGNTNKITAKDIQECTINSKTYTVFELTDAVGYRQKDKSLQIAEYLIKNDESLVMIVSLLSNFFFTLMKLNALMRRNISAKELKEKYMSEIYISFRDKYFEFLNNFNQKQIQNALQHLYDCDCRAKLSMAEDLVLITALVMGIIKNN